MFRKAAILTMAAAVFAFVAPAAASAAAVTDGSGTLLAVGSVFKVSSGNLKLETEGLGNVGCTSTELALELTKNNGTSAEAESGESAGTTSGCSVKGKSIEITDQTILNWQTFGNGQGVISLTEVVHFPTITCHYEGQNLSFTYTSGTDSFAVFGFLAGGGCGQASINGTFTAAGIIFD